MMCWSFGQLTFSAGSDIIYYILIGGRYETVDNNLLTIKIVNQ